MQPEGIREYISAKSQHSHGISDTCISLIHLIDKKANVFLVCLFYKAAITSRLWVFTYFKQFVPNTHFRFPECAIVGFLECVIVNHILKLSVSLYYRPV